MLRRWTIVAAALAAVMLAGVAFAQVSGVTETRLDNGLTVLMKEVHAAPVLTAQVWFDVGSRNEYTGITGISHLLEHMLFNSSTNYGKGDLSRMVRERGGIDNAATWTDFTYYWVLLSRDHLDFALSALSERMGGALLLPEELAKERTVVISELEGRENNVGTLLYQELMSTALVASTYQWPVIGWKSDVQNISRDQMQDYYDTYYHPNNATLVLVGDFDSAQALELVKKHFGSKPAGEAPPSVHTIEPPQTGRREVTLRKAGNAERVLLGYHVPAMTDPDAYALMVLDQILSGGRSSRLYQALVEKQLAISAWSSASLRQATSIFMLGAIGQQGVTSEQLEKALLEQVDLARSTLPTEEEMTAARNQLEAYLIFQNDSVSDQGEQLGYYATLADWRYLETLIPRLRAITPEEVQSVAQKYLGDSSVTVARFVPTATQAEAAVAPQAGPVDAAVEASASSYGAADGRGPAPQQAVTPSDISGSALVRPHRVVLENGIVVIVQENPANPTIAMSGSLKAGSYFDPTGKSGVAALTADMVQRGTKNRTALELAREIEYVGADISVSAGVESLQFGARSLSKDFSLILDLLSDQLRNADFPQDQFEKSKAEMAAALRQSSESPESRAFRAFHNKIYPAGHPYSRLTEDQAQQNLAAITREDLVEFHRSYYRPDTMIVAVVGDIKADAAVDAVRKYFGDWSAMGSTPSVDIATAAAGEPAREVIVMPEKSEVEIVFGYPMGLRRQDPDYYAVRIMNHILGGAGALTSKLGQEIREKQGLVYNVYSAFEAGLGAGPWYAALGTSSANADKAVDTLRTQIEEFRQQGATPQEFERAREFIVGVFPIALETNAGVAGSLRSAEFYGLGMDYLRNYDKIYRAVTLEQVNEAARKYLHPDRATLVIAGPYTGE